MMDIKKVLLVWFINFLIKKTKGSGIAIKNEITQNQQLVNEIDKPIIKKFKKRKVCSSSSRQYLGF